ncbi:MAG: tetratricopeptide repeat protein [Ignavibacteria bacterium]|nr:tetratricopeptide repeat protein [Ignavibacteria bacterium]
MSSSISPLFAVHAEQFYIAGNYAEALELCFRGIEAYPHYPAAYIITAKSLWALHRYSQAQEFILNAASIFPNHPALLRLEQEYFHPPQQKVVAEQTSNPRPISTEIESAKHTFENENTQLGSKDIESRNSGELTDDKEFHPEYSDITSDNKDSSTDATELVEFNNLTNTEEVIPPDTEHVPLEKYQHLRIIETVKVPNNFVGSLKASTISIIPGLDFTRLKFQNGQSHAKNGILPPVPPFLQFKERIRNEKSEQSTITDNQPEGDYNTDKLDQLKDTAEAHHPLTPLEELAARLEKVRIPATQQEMTRRRTTELDPTLVTETMARIYEKQSAFHEAIKAYQILARRTPEKLEFYEERIREVQLRMMGEEG